MRREERRRCAAPARARTLAAAAAARGEREGPLRLAGLSPFVEAAAPLPARRTLSPTLRRRIELEAVQRLW